MHKRLRKYAAWRIYFFKYTMYITEHKVTEKHIWSGVVQKRNMQGGTLKSELKRNTDASASRAALLILTFYNKCC